MQTFFQKYLLFKREDGLVPYFYMIFLIYPISAIFTMKPHLLLVSLVAIIIFYFSYRALYDQPKLIIWMLIIQLILVYYFMEVYQVFGMNNFASFVIGFINVPINKRKNAFIIYYVATIVMYMKAFVILNITQQGNNLTGMAFVLGFSLLAPIFSNSMRKFWNRNQELRAANNTLIVKQAEQQRIARDLHDNLGQSFSMITVKTELTKKLLAKDKLTEAKQQLDEIEEMSRENLQLVRDIVTDLRQTNLRDILTEQVKNLVQARITATITGEDLIDNISNDQQRVFGAILKETVTNIIRYSAANKAEIEFSSQINSFELSVSDNGMNIVNNRPGSHGIKGMQERASQFGGNVEIESDNTKTIVTCLLPKERVITND